MSGKAPATIDLYHLYRRFSLINLAYPIVLDALKVWAEAIGWQVRTAVCKESEVDITSDADVVGFSVYTQTATPRIGSQKSCAQRERSLFSAGPISGAPRHSRRPSLTAMFLSAASANASGKHFSAPSAMERLDTTASAPFW